MNTRTTSRLTATDAVVSDLFLLYVTTEKADGKKTSTWMANSADGGGYALNNTPSTKFFRYYTKEQANEIKKSLDKLEKLTPWSREGKTTYKVMSLRAAVNQTIKKMKEQMVLRMLASEKNVRATKNEIDTRVSKAEKQESEKIPVVF
jgi:hypothetical protein